MITACFSLLVWPVGANQIKIAHMLFRSALSGFKLVHPCFLFSVEYAAAAKRLIFFFHSEFVEFSVFD